MTGDELKDARKALGIRQRELADRLGLHPITISNYETGEFPIPRAIELAVLHLVSVHNLAQSKV